ncbi:hypothetical protein AB0J55_06255 [Amycolatopsis sp. NPDC049688]|uniref:hypothetical protein n=1 Tax=Amycolatopsis sp. NPDC049688 TaxID=3154733 RepID=UPI00342D5C77
MIDNIEVDAVHRTALLAMHDDTEPTLDAALTAQAETGVMIFADADACVTVDGQAALLTAAATGVRAFGHVHVLADVPDARVLAGVARGRSLIETLRGEGVEVLADTTLVEDRRRPILLIGATAAPEHGAGQIVLRASWFGWTATVTPAADAASGSDTTCPLAAVTAGALGISEIFGAMRARPGEDSGYRTATVNLWHPGSDEDAGPALAHAPLGWWLVGLGHLGQAHAWVLSWLPYQAEQPVEVVLQDTDRTILANHSTGVLTPRGSTGTPKTRLVAAALEHAGFTTRIVERRLGADLHVADTEPHVALLGVDNLPTRRLTSTAGWRFAVDVGLGSGHADFSSMLLRRFPGTRRSEDVIAWNTPPQAAVVPASTAFRDLATRGDPCGVVTLAGTAVGAAFVGVIAACLAVAEACRELHGGPGHDVLTLDLAAMDTTTAPADIPADVVSTSLLHR